MNAKALGIGGGGRSLGSRESEDLSAIEPYLLNKSNQKEVPALIAWAEKNRDLTASFNNELRSVFSLIN